MSALRRYKIDRAIRILAPPTSLWRQDRPDEPGAPPPNRVWLSTMLDWFVKMRRRLRSLSGIVVIERSPWTVLCVYARDLFQRSLLTWDDLDALRTRVRQLNWPPTQCFYVSATHDACLARMAWTGDQGEGWPSIEAVKRLNSLHDRSFGREAMPSVGCTTMDELACDFFAFMERQYRIATTKLDPSLARAPRPYQPTPSHARFHYVL